ncbi:MAG: hypothetical protein RL701_6907 [Pseudomonadota bacterium]
MKAALELARLQHWFADAITQPVGTSQLMAADIILPSRHLRPEARLEIYHSAYTSRLVDCLIDDYPALQHALGHETFRTLCLAYSSEFPSRSPSLNRFGERMPAFCRARDLSDNHAAAELAELEWAIVTVIHAAQGVALPTTALANLTPEQFGQSTFQACPAVRLLEHTFAVNEFYSAYRRTLPAELGAVRRGFTLVLRRGASVTREALAWPHGLILRELLAGQSVAEALNAAADSGITPELINRVFEHAFSHGLFVDTTAAAR